MLSDSQLLLRFRDCGDLDAIVLFIYSRHYASLRALVAAVVPPTFRCDSRDNMISEAIDDFFIPLNTPTSDFSHRLASYDASQPALPYIRQALRNFMSSRLEAEGARRASTLSHMDLSDPGAPADFPADAPAEDDGDAEEWRRLRVGSAIRVIHASADVLDPLRRYIFLTWLEDRLSRRKGEAPSRIIDAMALQLGMTPEQVRDRLNKAKRALRNFFSRTEDTKTQSARKR